MIYDDDLCTWCKYKTKEEVVLVVVKAKLILQSWKVEGGERREGRREGQIVCVWWV